MGLGLRLGRHKILVPRFQSLKLMAWLVPLLDQTVRAGRVLGTLRVKTEPDEPLVVQSTLKLLLTAEARSEHSTLATKWLTTTGTYSGDFRYGLNPQTPIQPLQKPFRTSNRPCAR